MRGRPSVSGRHGHYSGPSGPGGPKPPTKFEAGHFVGWDGEGKSASDGSTEYVYLANSEGGELVVEDGIDTATGLATLVREAQRIGPSATHVCFGLSYDANMVLRDVPRRDLRALWTGAKVRIGRRFKVAYRPRKVLWVKDYSRNASVNIWDVFGFFQSSFVQAVEDNLGKADPRLPLIREGKAKRSQFSVSDLPFIRTYTGAEVSALVDLCRNLRDAFHAANLKLRRWDGAGAAAAALLERENVRFHLPSRDRWVKVGNDKVRIPAKNPTPTEVVNAALYAYAGGRIETRLYGYHDGTIYHGDIRAAYPWAMLDLPSLSHGRWAHRGAVLPDEPFSVVKVRWNYSRLGYGWDLLPFAFRSTTGAIYFPRKGTTWAWRPEVEAALRFPDLARHTELLDAWAFVPDDETEHPFSFQRTIYDERRKLKHSKNGAQKALKLGQNSSYGKLAQNVGGTEENPPPYHDLTWAGYITSKTRARLFLAARAAPEGTVTLATDGIYSTEPLHLEPSEELGGWELSTHEAMLIAQSGVYWLRDRWADPDACQECHGPTVAGPFGTVRCVDPVCRETNLVSHFRGFDADSLNPDDILKAWKLKRTSVTATSTRFVTLGRATLTETQFGHVGPCGPLCPPPDAKGRPHGGWRRWVEEDRVLDIRPTGKRMDRNVSPRPRPERGFVPTNPSQPFGETESSPYVLGWAVERGEEASVAQEEASLR